jgi:hypothetical protein
MVIDFGNGEAIRARHEVDLQRDLEARGLRMQARQAGSRSRSWPSGSWNRLRCQMDALRVVLAWRLAAFGLHPAILGGDKTAMFSTGRCR